MVSCIIPFEGGFNLGPLAPHNIWELVAGAAFMVVIWLLYAKVVSPKIEAVYQERAERIQGGLERAERAEAEAAKARREYDEKLELAHSEASKIREDARYQASQMVAEAQRKANAEANRIISEAKLGIKAERDEVAKRLRSQLGYVAVELAGRVVGESLKDDERANRAIDRFLDDLATQPSKGLESEVPGR